MGERLLKSPMPERQVGDSFKPFKDLVVFPAINIEDGYSQELFAHGFVFKGAPCSLSVNAFEPDELFDKQTPLGRVKIVKSWENGKETAEELPIKFYLSTKVQSFEKYEEFGKYAVEVELGGKKYYLSLGGEDDNITGQNFDRNESVDDYFMKDERGEAIDIALPFDPNLIRDLSVDIVQKDMGPHRAR